MKKPFLLLHAVCFLLFARGTTYYSNTAAPNVLSTWHINRNGTGASPANFSNADIFIIQADQTLTVTANWTISNNSAQLIMESGATLQANFIVNVKNFQMDAGSYYIHNVASSTFPGSTTKTLDPTSTVEIRNWNGTTSLPSPTAWGYLTLNVNTSYNSNWNQAGTLTSIAGDFKIISTGNSSKELRLAGGQDYTLTIGGDFIIQGGNIEASSSNTNADQVIIINGSYNQSGGTFYRTNTHINYLTIQFDGSNSSFTKSAGTLTNTYMNWVVNASKTLDLNNDLPVASGRSVTINGTLNCNNQHVSGSGAFTLGSAGKLTTSNAAGIDGSITTSGTETFNSTASYQFYTATTAPFPAALISISAKDILINANVTINKNVSLSGTLTLNTGKLTIPSANTVTITSGNSIGGSGFDATKHIVTQVNNSTGAMGMLRIGNFSGSKTFPVGNGTYYMPVLLNVTSASDFSVCVFQGATSNGTPNGTAFSANAKKGMIDAIWVVNRNSGLLSANMQLSWSSALEGSNFVSFSDNQIGISHFDGVSWDQSIGSGSQSLNTVTRSAILSFSPFGIGFQGVPLPLKFGDIKLSQKNNGVQVTWTSYTETNIDHYEIERSTDGQHFNFAGKVAATGNNYSTSDYSWLDITPLNAVNFYRIKAVNTDGKSVYSTLVRIDPGQSMAELILYPNPAVGKRISFHAGNIKAGEYEVAVYDNSGRTVYNQHIDHHGGIISQAIQLPSGINTGIYSLQIKGNDLNMVKPFMVR